MIDARPARPQARPSPTNLPPAPRMPRWLQTILWGFQPTSYLTWCQRRYGDLFTVRLPEGGTLVVASHPAAVKEIFALPADAYSAEDAAPILEPFLGAQSLLLLDGERHRRERRVLARALHGDRMETYESLIMEATERDLETWPVATPFAVWPHMQQVTLEVILRAVFGVAPGDELERLRAPLRRFLTDAVSITILNPAWRKDLGRFSPWGRFVRLRAAVDRLVEGEIARRRTAPDLEARTDVMSVLIQARDENGDGLSDDALRDELITMLLAGHDTTATGIAWAIDLLVHHPPVLDRLTEAVTDGEDDYLDAVVREVLRLRPVVPDAGRTLTRPATIGGWLVPAGVTVVPSILLLHRRGDLYPRALEFRPERFLQDAHDVQNWIPFGGGLRRCIGAGLANLELRVVLRSVVRRMQLCPADRRPARPRRRAVTLAPRTGVRVIAQPRRERGRDAYALGA